MSAPARTLVAPVRGVPVVLPAIRPEKTFPAQTLVRLYGWEFSMLTKDGKVPSWVGALPWPQAVARLRDGVEVTIQCTESGKSHYNSEARQDHRLYLHPDGTVTMIDHPQQTTPVGGHSAHLDLDAWTVLHRLGAAVPTCVKMAVGLHAESLDPVEGLKVSAALGVQVKNSYWPGRHVRPMWAAVAWAQQDVWPRAAWSRFLGAGITPAALSYWIERGWSVTDAVLFMYRHAPFDVAEQWRVSGDLTKQAAVLAGQGEFPDDEQPWLDAGFAPGEAYRWMTASAHRWGSRPGREPAVALMWHRARVLPKQVNDFEALDPTKETIATGRALVRPSRETAMDWSRAGVPSDVVLTWYHHLHQTPHALETALAWSRTVPAAQYQGIADWNTDHPDDPLTPMFVASMARFGLTNTADIMGAVLINKVDPAVLSQVLGMIPQTKRWLGLQARSVLATVPTPGSNPNVSTFAARMEAGEWDKVTATLRNSPAFARDHWLALIEWLATDPTPPRFGEDPR